MLRPSLIARSPRSSARSTRRARADAPVRHVHRQLVLAREREVAEVVGDHRGELGDRQRVATAAGHGDGAHAVGRRMWPRRRCRRWPPGPPARCRAAPSARPGSAGSCPARRRGARGRPPSAPRSSQGTACASADSMIVGRTIVRPGRPCGLQHPLGERLREPVGVGPAERARALAARATPARRRPSRAVAARRARRPPGRRRGRSPGARRRRSGAGARAGASRTRARRASGGRPPARRRGRCPAPRAEARGPLEHEPGAAAGGVGRGHVHEVRRAARSCSTPPRGHRVPSTFSSSIWSSGSSNDTDAAQWITTSTPSSGPQVGAAEVALQQVAREGAQAAGLQRERDLGRSEVVERRRREHLARETLARGRRRRARAAARGSRRCRATAAGRRRARPCPRKPEAPVSSSVRPDSCCAMRCCPRSRGTAQRGRLPALLTCQ